MSQPHRDGRDDALASLTSAETLMVFAYAPTGLGHLRVTDALWKGLGMQGAPLVLGADDKLLATAHRLLSQRKSIQALFEWSQSGRPQSFLTPWYRGTLRRRGSRVRAQLLELLRNHPVAPKRLVVVATHFDVAHRVAGLKATFEKETGVPLLLVVQVTDDSPQHIWLVPGADLICVPSHPTRDSLVEYARASKLEPPPFAVLPYPIPGELSVALPEDLRAQRREQLRPGGELPVQVAVPISGAAAGLAFLGGLMAGLRGLSTRYAFHLVSRVAPYTCEFLAEQEAAGAEVASAPRNREVIDAYASLYETNVVALELTKPSEQAFKALVGSDARGGAILLFAPTVGRQEEDNLEFLRRHRLVPTVDEAEELFRLFRLGSGLEEASAALQAAAAGWRGLTLPTLYPIQVSGFVHWALESGLLARMDGCAAPWERDTPNAAEELRPDGVRRFWEMVARAAEGLAGGC